MKRLYDYRCKSCSYECEEIADIKDDVSCPKCGKVMTKLITGAKYRIKSGDFFEPYVDTNIHPEGEPIVLNSKEEFKDACRKHNRGWRAIPDKTR